MFLQANTAFTSTNTVPVKTREKLLACIIIHIAFHMDTSRRMASKTRMRATWATSILKATALENLKHSFPDCPFPKDSTRWRAEPSLFTKRKMILASQQAMRELEPVVERSPSQHKR